MLANLRSNIVFELEVSKFACRDNVQKNEVGKLIFVMLN